MNIDATIQLIALMTVPAILAITVHEVAHGWVAKKNGDPTAFLLGRLTLNPIKHVDPIGTIVVPAVLITLAGVPFGWAKPVPVVFENLHNPKRDMALVAIAGPFVNLVMALIWGVLMKLGFAIGHSAPSIAVPLVGMAQIGIQINVVLMVLNMIPLPPLDGGRVLAGLVPDSISNLLARIEPYGLVVLIALLVSGILGEYLLPVVNQVSGFIGLLLGL